MAYCLLFIDRLLIRKQSICLSRFLSNICSLTTSQMKSSVWHC